MSFTSYNSLDITHNRNQDGNSPLFIVRFTLNRRVYRRSRLVDSRERPTSRSSLSTEDVGVRTWQSWIIEIITLISDIASFRWAKQKSHLIFTDTKFNSYHVACQNVHANFLFTAMKMINYLKSWGIDTTSHHKFILGEWQRLIWFSCESK